MTTHNPHDTLNWIWDTTAPDISQIGPYGKHLGKGGVVGIGLMNHFGHGTNIEADDAVSDACVSRGWDWMEFIEARDPEGNVTNANEYQVQEAYYRQGDTAYKGFFDAELGIAAIVQLMTETVDPYEYKGRTVSTRQVILNMAVVGDDDSDAVELINWIRQYDNEADAALITGQDRDPVDPDEEVELDVATLIRTK